MSLRATCPGAILLAGPDPIGPTAICGPLANDRDKEGPGRLQGQQNQVIFSAGKDPSTFHGACCGNYQACVIWMKEKERIQAGLHSLESVV